MEIFFIKAFLSYTSGSIRRDISIFYFGIRKNAYPKDFTSLEPPMPLWYQQQCSLPDFQDAVFPLQSILF